MKGSNLPRGISSTPGVCGGEPCITGTRIPVWLLVQARHLGTNDETLLASYPMLNTTDLENAWQCASEHSAEIAEQIRENETD